MMPVMTEVKTRSLTTVAPPKLSPGSSVSQTMSPVIGVDGDELAGMDAEARAHALGHVRSCTGRGGVHDGDV